MKAKQDQIEYLKTLLEGILQGLDSGELTKYFLQEVRKAAQLQENCT